MFAHKEQKQILITLKSVCSADISYWFKWHIIAFTPVVGSVFQKYGTRWFTKRQALTVVV